MCCTPTRCHHHSEPTFTFKWAVYDAVVFPCVGAQCGPSVATRLVVKIYRHIF